MSAAIRKLRARVAAEDGAIAMATLCFLIFTGFIVITTLWGIAYITGAYNTLYSANQAAAYAAATATGETSSAPSPQLRFACSSRSGPLDTVCMAGPSMNAASAVMSATFAPNAPGSFGLSYDSGAGPRVRLTGAGYGAGANQISIYEIGMPASRARQLAQAPPPEGAGGCNPGAGSDHGVYDPYPQDQLPGTLVCWRLSEFGIEYSPQYQSSVVTRAAVDLPLLPGCDASFCPVISLRTVAAATQDQPEPPDSYGDYFPIPSSERPVWVLYRPGTDTHLWTMYEEERASAESQGFVCQGVGFAGWSAAAAVPGVRPVYRLHSLHNRGFLYTLIESERDNAVASGAWSYDGIAFRALSSSGGPTTVPVWRLQKQTTGGSLFYYTAWEAEKDSLVASGTFTLNGVAFHAPKRPPGSGC